MSWGGEDVKEAMGQHMAIVDRVVMEHVLWCPAVLDVCPSVVAQVKQTFVHLNDGRSCSVVTSVGEVTKGLFRAETLVSYWVRPEAPEAVPESARSSG